MHTQSLQRCLFATPWTVACQASSFPCVFHSLSIIWSPDLLVYFLITGLTKKLILVFLWPLTEKLEGAFWPTEYKEPIKSEGNSNTKVEQWQWTLAWWRKLSTKGENSLRNGEDICKQYVYKELISKIQNSTLKKKCLKNGQRTLEIDIFPKTYRWPIDLCKNVLYH